MLPLKKSLTTAVGQKFLMAVTGLALIGFLITHLLANLLIYQPQGTALNEYAHKLASFGFLLYVAEVGLLLMAVIHVVVAASLAIKAKKARPQSYAARGKSKRGESKAGPSASYMKLTGLVLLAFLIFHVPHLKFGPSITEGYTTLIHGETGRNLHRLVIEEFKKPAVVAFYTLCMAFMFFHLRHGFWSAFQSLGAMSPRFARPIYGLAWLLAAVLAVGFLLIPLWVYFDFLGVYQ